MKKSSDQQFAKLMRRLESLADPRAVEGMARYGIVTKKVYGIPSSVIRQIAKEIGNNHRLAAKLWSTGVLDARGFASLIDDPAEVTEEQMERWVLDFDNWATCDVCCSNLFDKTPFAWTKAVDWSKRDEEFVKRAGYVLMAALAVHDKRTDDATFLRFLPHIRRGATDERNFVKKAVNWALRQIGKRSLMLNKEAIRAANEIHKLNLSSARWIASDALRELTSTAVQRRLKKKAATKTGRIRR